MARLSIQKVHVGEKDTNCYVVACGDSHEAVVIDPGDDAPKIAGQLAGKTVRWICFTHAHPGHTGAKEAIKGATGAATAMHLADATANLKSGRSIPGGRGAAALRELRPGGDRHPGAHARWALLQGRQPPVHR